MNEHEEVIIQKAVVMTLQMLGVSSGFLSYNKASKLYGKRFIDKVKKGEIEPVYKAQGIKGKQTYSINEILSSLNK